MKTHKTTLNDEARTTQTNNNPTSMELEFAEWGRKLKELRNRADLVGKDLVDDLEHRYRAIERQAKELKRSASSQVHHTTEEAASIADSAKGKVSEAIDEASKRVTAAGESASDTASRISKHTKAKSTQLKEGAGDVAMGFEHAWEALRRSFEKAYSRLQ